MQSDDTILRVFIHPNRPDAVFVVRRPDGLYSFCKETLDERDAEQLRRNPMKTAEHDIVERIKVKGLHVGLYADEQGATYEALCRVEWLFDVFTTN